MTDDYVKILDVLKKYLDILYRGDTGIIDQIFSPEAKVSSVTNKKIVSVDMIGFNERITNRKSPESVGEKREDKILMIDISSPTTAIAKVKCMILGNQYTDYLSLIKVQGKWFIISKVFHMETKSERIS